MNRKHTLWVPLGGGDSPAISPAYLHLSLKWGCYPVKGNKITYFPFPDIFPKNRNIVCKSEMLGWRPDKIKQIQTWLLTRVCKRDIFSYYSYFKNSGFLRYFSPTAKRAVLVNVAFPWLIRFRSLVLIYISAWNVCKCTIKNQKQAYLVWRRNPWMVELFL